AVINKRFVCHRSVESHPIPQGNTYLSAYGQKGPFVYVVKPDNTVEMRPVQVALTEGENSAISEGVKSGEKVVVEGQTRLKDGAAIHEGKAAGGDQAAPKVAEAGKAAAQ
ncbi:hypothetical protein NKJ66_31645, partial [Mesorhizobium sp. M0078]